MSAHLKSNGRPEGEILVTYGVRKANSGWVPWVADDDERRHELLAACDDRDIALATAKQEAESLASRYIGDWTVAIEIRLD